MRRVSREERRLQYLDAAVALLVDKEHRSTDESGLVLSHVKLDDVAARAKVSKGTLYHIWPSQEAYWAELLKLMLTSTTAVGPDMTRWISDVVAPGYDGPAPTFLDFARCAFESRATNPAMYIRASLHAYRTRSRVEPVPDKYQYKGSRFVATASAILKISGRQLNKQVTMEQVVASLEGLITGLAMMSQYSPHSTTPIKLTGDTSIDLFGLANEASLYYYSQAGTDQGETGNEKGQRARLGQLLDSPLDQGTYKAFYEYLHEESKRNKPRIVGEDRAGAYLQIGLDLLREISPQMAAERGIDAFANIRIADVAAHVGVSKGSIYHLWPDQESFRLEVLQHLLETWSTSNRTHLEAVVADLRRQSPTPDQFLQTVCDTTFDALKTDERFFARFSFALYLGNLEVSKMFRDGNLEINALFGSLLAEYLEAKGRRLRPGLPDDILVTYAEAAVHGLCFVYRFDPELIDGHRCPQDGQSLEPRPASRLAETMASLCDHLTEPVPG